MVRRRSRYAIALTATVRHFKKSKRAELRDQFIAVLGHDLRNPLASVGAIGEILARRPDTGIAKYGQRLRANTRRISKLIDDVLDLARGRMGAGMGLRIEAVADLETALRDVVAELRDSYPQWIIDESYRMDGQVEWDLSRVQQLLSNLLGNALAYGEPSEPLILNVSIDLFWLEISVRNGGEPISPDNLQKIFEPFWRTAESRPCGGLGLGLHICSQIVKAHGGVRQVSSSAESGTCFTARLPARAGSTAIA